MADGFFATLVSKDANANLVTNPIFVELSDGTNPVTSFTVTQATGSNLHVVVDAGSAVIGHVIMDSGSTTAVTGNVTVVQPTGTNLHVVVDGSVAVTGTFWQATQPISAASLPLPTGASTSALQTTGNSSLSSIDGKLNSLGQKTMAGSVPVVLASDQSAITVSSGIAAQTGAVCDYATASSVAGGSTSNHDYTVTTSMKVSEVSFASSGAGKVELKVGPVASLVSKWVAFVPKAGGEVKMVFNPPIVVPTTSTGTVRLVMTNRENTSQDLYSTIVGVDA